MAIPSPPTCYALLLLLTCFNCCAQSAQSGGQTTVFDHSRNAFTRPSPNLTERELRLFHLGNRVFNTKWVQAPASVSGFDGLGPLFSRDACSGCHVRDGRGRLANGSPKQAVSHVVRFAPKDKRSRKIISRYFGAQLDPHAIPGVQPEGHLCVTYNERRGQYPDGSIYRLRQPSYRICESKIAFPKHSALSVRVAPAVFGLGLIESIPSADILRNEDSEDRDGDGISGRANWVFSNSLNARTVGRFGWKANTATLEDQALEAAFNDIGLTSHTHSNQNCALKQAKCKAAYSSSDPDLSDHLTKALVTYLQTLAVPSRRAQDSEVEMHGRRLFEEIGCGACHKPSWQTNKNTEIEVLGNQTFFPYSDFLLHDMGEELSDSRPDQLASGREWRTAPLWGLGLYQVVNGHTHLLHDGRARNIEEAILWHDGEAAHSKNRFAALDARSRLKLIEFLNSL